MIEISITENIVEKAQRKAEAMGRIKNSITKGSGNLAGFIGEELVNLFVGGKTVNTYDYDIVKNDVKIDVKTKRCTSPPRPHYDCSIAALSTHQKCDKYIFVRVEWHKERPDEWKRAWILGEITKKEYFKKARYLNKGDIDKSNNFVVKADCHNLPISKLYPLSYKYESNRS